MEQDDRDVLLDQEGPFGIFREHPHECCVFYRTMIILGIWPTIFLVLHHAYLLQTTLNCYERYCTKHERFWFYWCLLRLGMVIPRPIWWLRAVNSYTRAMRAQNPQEITRRLIVIHQSWWIKMNHTFGTFFTIWLLMTCALCYSDFFKCHFSKLLWNHCLLNLANQLAQRLVSIGMLLYLTNANMKRGITESMLSHHSEIIVYGNEEQAREKLGPRTMECSICFASYCKGDRIRLIKCSHHYHEHCIDPWLIRYRNRCPLCNYAVGESKRRM